MHFINCSVKISDIVVKIVVGKWVYCHVTLYHQ